MVDKRNKSCGCFSWLSVSKQPRSFEEDKAAITVPEDARPNLRDTPTSISNPENRVRLSRESGRSGRSRANSPGK